MKTVMKHDFSKVPTADIPRSTFDRSHGHKTTIDAGLLYPFLVDEALPGDTFRSKTTILARLATPIFPVMDNMYMDTQFFAVPMRLVWENWQKFNGEQANPADSTDFLIPQIDSGAGFAEDSLEDHLGLPVGVPGMSVSCLWHRAYNLIFNEWYRDQNLINSAPINIDDGPDPVGDYTLLRRGKRHDYFTSGLPFAQKGDSVTIPLGTSAPVTTDAPTGNILGVVSTTQADAIKDMTASGATVAMGTGTVVASGSLYADLSEATAATINELRQSFQIQKMLERDARGGSRYTEIIKSHFGVTSPDSRLQRPEYLGGGSAPVSFNQVEANTVDTNQVTGDLSAYAISVSHEHGFSKSFTEHCLIIGILSVRADLTYQQGIPRMFSRNTRFDFYWPALSHLGEQIIANKEIFAQGSGDPTADEAVFAYQERNAEYRYKPSQITGAFRSTHSVPLDAWHLSQDFATLPVLDETFIEENPPVDRIIAVAGQPHFIVDTYTKMHCARPMPVYGVPGLIDHF